MKARMFELLSAIISLSLLLSLVPNGAVLTANSPRRIETSEIGFGVSSTRSGPATLPRKTLTADPHPAFAGQFSDSVSVDSIKRAKLKTSLNQLPLSFVENQGQLNEKVAYYVRGRDKTIYFTPRGLTYTLTDAEKRERWTVNLDFVDANPYVRPMGQQKAETTISYFKGTPQEWHTDLPTFREIVYKDLWPGIDLIYHGTVNRLKYEFLVHPGGDPAQIRLAYRGAEITANKDGELEVKTPEGYFYDETPVAHQEINGETVPVKVAYDLRYREYGFELGSYDPNHELILDPAVLVYCGYIGGSGSEKGTDIAVDDAGNAYVTGESLSPESDGFPVTVGPDLTYNSVSEYDGDAFVCKIKADGTGLDYCGYIGGSGDDSARGIAVDGAGNAYVVGNTGSSELEGFPVVVGPDLSFNEDDNGKDAFVAKVKADGSDLDYCGYIGGSRHELGYGVAVDGSGNAYVVGSTGSSESDGFPVAVGPDLTYNGGGDDTFVAKVKADGTSLDYCGYIGGLGHDIGHGIAVNGAGNAYVVGRTGSSESQGFPVRVGPDLTFNGGSHDAFVSKVKVDGSALEYCGYIGGAGSDRGYDVAVDSVSSAYVVGGTGSTQSEGFPATGGPDLTFNGGNQDAFVAKVGSDGSKLDYCGYIGGLASDLGQGIAVDKAGRPHVVGGTGSTEAEGFPVRTGPDLTHNGASDAFVARVEADGSGLDYCGYIGGSDLDHASAVTIDETSSAYVVGQTASCGAEGFPTTVGPDIGHNGGPDAFVAKVGIPGNHAPDAPTNLNQTRPVGTPISVGQTIAERSVILNADVGDPDGDQVRLEVELRRLDEYGGEFDQAAAGLKRSTYVESGSQARCLAYDLISADYHWRARAVDEYGSLSDWVGYGGNLISESDFTVAANQSPNAHFIYVPANPKSGEEVRLSASSSDDPDGEIDYYEWDLDGDGEYDGDTTSPEIFYYWTESGDYSVTLRVIDNSGNEDTFAREINVQPGPWWEDVKEFFAPTVEELSKKEKRRFELIKSKLCIKNTPHYDDPTSDPDFYWLTDDQLYAVLQKKVEPDASDLTYETTILDALHHLELAEFAAHRDYVPDPAVEDYFQEMAEINVWAEEALILLPELIDGLLEAGGGSGNWVGPLMMIPDVADAGIGLKLLNQLLGKKALWSYFYFRDMASSQEAFDQAIVAATAGQWDNEATREFFEELWQAYGGSNMSPSGGVKPEVRDRVVEELRNLLLSGVERYQFEVPYELYVVNSPVELRCYNSQGQVTGLVNGVVREQIPQSAYGSANESLLIFNSIGSYYCEVIGTDTGDYELVASSIKDSEATTFRAVDIPTSPSAVHRYIPDWHALSESSDGVTVQVDSDGDGRFERVIKADEDLTQDEFLPPVPVGGQALPQKEFSLRAHLLALAGLCVVALFGIAAVVKKQRD